MEATKEKQGVSIESSRSSFSSTTSSSTFSSVDCNRKAQPEPSSLGPNKFPRTPSQKLPKTQPNSLHSGQQILDLQDVVKDSIYRQTCGLSVKTPATTSKRENRVINHVDSPRPPQLSKCMKPKDGNADRSFQAVKLQEGAPSYGKEKPQVLLPKDAPRFSYDGRETRDTWKSAMKLKELPRLSLDSREGSIRKDASESRSNYLLEDLQCGTSGTLNTHQEPGSNKRPSSVVAKLMGLEAFPDTLSGEDDQTMNIRCNPNADIDKMSSSSRITDSNKHNQVAMSPKTPQKEPAAQLRNFTSSRRPSTRFPLEPAPWRQPDATRGTHKMDFMHAEAHTEAQSSRPSIYGEIEKRLSALEFKRSGKDLRALKQIIEAMQKTQKRLDTEKEDPSDLEPQRSNHRPNNSSQNSKSAKQRSRITPTLKGTGPPKKLESSIVLIKPAKVVQKPKSSGSLAIPIEGISGLPKLRMTGNAESRKDLVNMQTAKYLTPRNNHFREPPCQSIHYTYKSNHGRTFRSTQAPKLSQQMTGGSSPSSGRSSATMSPRMQRSKELEKQSSLTTCPTDSTRARRHSGKHQKESGSPTRKFKPKSPSLQHGDDQLNEFSSETRHLNYQGDAVSVKSDSNMSLLLHNDIEVTSIDHIKEINVAYQYEDQKDEVAVKLSERSKAEPTTTIVEQPSPVSVLDAAFYGEETPSPVKKISNAFKDDEALNYEEAGWNLTDLDPLLNGRRPTLSPAFDQAKLENIKHLVHKPRKVSSTHDRTNTEYIDSLCQNPDRGHVYIAKILLASGLLKDLASISASIQLHPSGHLINPNLFLILEQAIDGFELPDNSCSTEKIGQSKLNKKIQRKLIFDTVNEILIRKLTSQSFSEPWISPSTLGARSFSGQTLLTELCSEIDRLQAKPDCSIGYEDDGLTTKDVMHEQHNWEDSTEISGLVLDIERLIFKDLIVEVLSGEMADLKGRPTKHCRQLFSKQKYSFSPLTHQYVPPFFSD